MFLGSTMGMAGLVLFHIITHGFVKASAFVSSGVVIGARGDQDLRGWGISMELIVMNMCFLLLCGVRGSIVFSSKEFILLEFVRVAVIVVRWSYSKTFLHNTSGYNCVMTVMNSSGLLLLLSRGSGFSGLDLVSLTSMTVLGVFVINSMAGYVVNK